MTADQPSATGPGQARKIMDDLEADIEAEAAETETGKDREDWVPEVPGSGEPPD